MSNKKIGNDFENEFCEILSENGFWVHNFAQNQAGQPADVIAVRDGGSFLIDCKVCITGRFQLNRIEENQQSAMRHWVDTGNEEAWFALKIENDIVMMRYSDLMLLKTVQSSLNKSEILKHGVMFEKWVDNEY
uniref:Holliday junction resolvase n=1 Tax=Siphoviridae sp. ctmqu18 TaxID=2825655 RepID=A0A8S5V6K1_9CAUD|nr:MAG TPA: holliday junction resolvase [Siphoviridae sp. ctmqu18]